MAGNYKKNPHLRQQFQNPPKGGNATGVPTLNSMSPLPPPQVKHDHRGGGQTIRERRLAQELEAMSPADRRKAMMAGMELGPPPDTGPGAVTTMRATFEAGEASGRRGTQESHKAQSDYNPINGKFDGRQSEFRNYRRSPDPTQRSQGPATGHYTEEERSYYPRAGAAGTGNRPYDDRPKPDENPNPNTQMDARRSDGKRQYSMGRPDGNATPAPRQRRNRRGPFD